MSFVSDRSLYRSVSRIACSAALVLGACSSTDLIQPRESSAIVVDSADANELVLTVGAAPASGLFIEQDTVIVTAAVLSAYGTPVVSGDVSFSGGGYDIEQRGSRSAKTRLKLGINVVKATFRNRHGVVLQASLTIGAKPAAQNEIAVVWQADGSITEIPRPADVRAIYPRAINDRGEVVGTAQLASNRRAFIWSEAAGFRIISSPSEDYSEGTDINDDGIVAGYRNVSMKPSRIDGFLWTSAGGFLPISSNLGTTTATGINDSGVVAGGRDYAAVRWSKDGGFTELATPSGTRCSNTIAIAGSGYVIGFAGMQLSNGWCLHWSPVIWEPNGKLHVISDCSAQLDCMVQVADVNSAGEVIGNRNGRPFRWSLAKGFQELLGDAFGVATGLNERGEVAGEIDYPTAMPIVWGSDNRMRILSIPPGHTTGFANALNNKGQVVGTVK